MSPRVGYPTLVRSACENIAGRPPRERNRMRITFAHSPRSSIGIEWELAVVDPISGELVPRAPDLLTSLPTAGDDGPNGVTGELLTNTIELVSGVHRTVDGAVHELAGLLTDAHTAAERVGAALISSGTHPTARWEDQEISPSERYARLIERTQWWGRNMLIWGLHVHVGVERADKAIPLLNALAPQLAMLQSFTASSPYWAGHDTGFASQRAMMFQQLPGAGLPEILPDWHAYERHVTALRRAEGITDHSELRWDLRPSPRWGTVEMRALDAPSTLAELASAAALVHCLTEEASRALDEGRPSARPEPWRLHENKWRSARYGLDAVLVTNDDGDTAPVREELAAAAERLRPVAKDLGCVDELAAVAGFAERPGAAERQRAAVRAHGGNPTAAVHTLIEELRAGRR